MGSLGMGSMARRADSARIARRTAGAAMAHTANFNGFASSALVSLDWTSVARSLFGDAGPE
jgi:hypothetical protein